MLIVILVILSLPLLGFLILGLGFKVIPAKVTTLVAPGTILISFLLSLITTINISQAGPTHQYHLFTWFSIQNFSLDFNLLIDPLTCVMMLIITGVGFLIHLYSVGYMKHEAGQNRFFAYMNLFVFSMLLLVMAANYPVMFIGWEGVGLCSYLLIGFWFKTHEFNNAARKAFIMNRIGDFGFLFGMFFLFQTFGSFDFKTIFDNAKFIPSGESSLIIITMLLLVGAVGKSAQIPLYTWLPDAMAGPTPVSALIHAATMVTAGVYMIARSSILYVLAPTTMAVIVGIGLSTAIFSAIIAVFQNDIKKILAYSTISQLGYMFIALALGAFTGAIFHLTTHAFFKALLFLAAGSVIHSLHGEQDIRKMGGLKKLIPKTWFIFLIGTISISGIPPFAGFFSKDLILMSVFEKNIFQWLFAVFGIILTALYMFRLFFMVFSGNFKGDPAIRSTIKDSGNSMIYPMLVLSLLSIAGGLLNLPGSTGISSFMGNFLNPVFSDTMMIIQNSEYSQPHFDEILLAGFTTTTLLLVIFITHSLFIRKQKIFTDTEYRPRFLTRLFVNKFYVDEFYTLTVVKPLNYLSELLFRRMEMGFIDKIINGIGRITQQTGTLIRLAQSGHTGFYLFGMVVGIIVILFIFIILK